MSQLSFILFGSRGYLTSCMFVNLKFSSNTIMWLIIFFVICVKDANILKVQVESPKELQ